MSPAHSLDPVKVQTQRSAQRVMAAREGRNRDRGRLAEQLVRGWSTEQRARIKARALEYPEGLLSPELVELIDRITEEEAGK